MVEKVVIIGSGPAGWSAAIYAARANLNPLVYEGTYKPDMVPLGQLAFTTEVENYPGFPAGDVRAYASTALSRKELEQILAPTPKEHVRDGRPHYAVQGTELVALMKQQAINFGTRVITDDIVGVEFGEGPPGKPHRLMAGEGQSVEARTVIVATGAAGELFGTRIRRAIQELRSQCLRRMRRMLPRFRKKPLVVVGGGDTAVEEATYLTNFAERVYMVHRRDELRASKIMQQRVLTNPKVEMLWNSAVKECRGDEKSGLTSVLISSTKNDETREIQAAGMFVAIGHTPNTAFLAGKLEMNDKGYLRLTTPFRTNTSVPGVFAAGDVSDDYYRQAITSAGTGCMAALDAERLLAQFEHH